MLAVHVGYEIVKKGTSVRYINVEENLSLLKDKSNSAMIVKQTNASSRA